MSHDPSLHPFDHTRIRIKRLIGVERLELHTFLLMNFNPNEAIHFNLNMN